jgi:HK97 gp10 family phage protein
MTNKTEVIGFPELEDALRKLGPMIAGKKGYPKNPLRNAARAGAKIAEDAARENAPERTGTLRKAITKKLMSAKYRDQALMQGDSREYYYIGATAGKGRTHDAYYAKWVERGTDRLAARPFLRPAVTRNTKKIQSAIDSKLRKDLIKIAKKIGDENTRALLSKGVKP